MGNCLANEPSPSINEKGSSASRPSSSKDENYFRLQVQSWIKSGNLEMLGKAQNVKQTKFGLKVMYPATIMLSNTEVEVIRDDKGASDDVRLIMNPPFSDISRITEKLFLSGMAGLTIDNVSTLNISLIVNVTYEMPIVIRPHIAGIRIPIDDDPLEEIYPYLDNVSDIIQRAASEGYRCVVHCVAGASRSATVVIAYLVKHQNLSLKEAFCYVHACRQCARPNMGFFKQLIKFESRVRKSSSVQMLDYLLNGYKVRLPNFYKNEFPDLFLAEGQKQIKTQQEQTTAKDSMNSMIGTTKGKMSNNKTMLSHQEKRQKIHLKEAYDEINQIRIRSCASKISSNQTKYSSAN